MIGLAAFWRSFNRQKTWTITRRLGIRIVRFSREMKLTKQCKIIFKKSRSHQKRGAAVAPIILPLNTPLEAVWLWLQSFSATCGRKAATVMRLIDSEALTSWVSQVFGVCGDWQLYRWTWSPACLVMTFVISSAESLCRCSSRCRVSLLLASSTPPLSSSSTSSIVMTGMHVHSASPSPRAANKFWGLSSIPRRFCLSVRG